MKSMNGVSVPLLDDFFEVSKSEESVGVQVIFPNFALTNMLQILTNAP